MRPVFFVFEKWGLNVWTDWSARILFLTIWAVWFISAVNSKQDFYEYVWIAVLFEPNPEKRFNVDAFLCVRYGRPA